MAATSPALSSKPKAPLYSSSRSGREVVVIGTLPVCKHHLNKICAGVLPCAAAAALTGASTSPPGTLVSGARGAYAQRVGVRLDLVAAWLDLGVLIDGLEVAHAPVAHAHRLHQAFVDERLHLPPDLRQRGGEGRAVALEGRVHEVEVQVVTAERMQAATANGLDATLGVHTQHLARDVQSLAWHGMLRQPLLQGLAGAVLCPRQGSNV
eukprot:scaffold61863_cov75-Phaeocystis_antarctica.AAC.1